MDAGTAKEHTQGAQRGSDRAELAARAERLKQQRAEEERNNKELARKKKLRKSSSSKPMRRSGPTDREAQRNSAVTKIQAVQRGKQTRQQQQHRALAATKIQARHRGALVRREQQTKRDSDARGAHASWSLKKPQSF